LHEPRVLRFVLEHLTNLPDRRVDTGVRIDEDVTSPDPFLDLFPRDKLTALFDQQHQQLHGDAFELERTAGTTELASAEIEFKIASELDGIRR
jgi:hypothetical protein